MKSHDGQQSAAGPVIEQHQHPSQGDVHVMSGPHGTAPDDTAPDEDGNFCLHEYDQKTFYRISPEKSSE